MRSLLPDSIPSILLPEFITSTLSHLFTAPYDTTTYILSPWRDTSKNADLILDEFKIWMYSPSIPTSGWGREDTWWRIWNAVLDLGRTLDSMEPMERVILLGWVGVGVIALLLGWQMYQKSRSMLRSDLTPTTNTYQNTDMTDFPPTDSTLGPISTTEKLTTTSTPTVRTHTQSLRALAARPRPKSSPTSSPIHPSSHSPIPPQDQLLKYIHPNSSLWPVYYLRAFRLAIESLHSQDGYYPLSHQDAPVSVNLRQRENGRRRGRAWNGKVVLSRRKVIEDLGEGVVGLRKGVEGLVSS